MKEKSYFKDSKNPLPSGEKSEFAERLKGLREEYGLSKEAVSLRLNLSKSTYGTYENDKYFPEPKILRNIAEYFHTTTDYLLGLTDERHIVKGRKKKEKPKSAASSVLVDEKRPLRIRGPVESKKYLEFEDYFVHGCRIRFADIQHEAETKKMFEDLVTDEGFVEFLKLVYSYTTYSAKIKKEEVRGLKQNGLYEKIFYVDVSGDSVGKLNRVESRATMQELYYGLMHKSLDEMINNLIGKNHYIQELMRVIEEERARLG